MAKKNLSNIIAAKSIKVQSVPLMPGVISTVYMTIFIFISSLLPLHTLFDCPQAAIMVTLLPGGVYNLDVQDSVFLRL